MGGLTIATSGQTTVEADEFGDLIVTNAATDGSTAQISATDGFPPLGRSAVLDSRSGVILYDETRTRFVDLTMGRLILPGATAGELTEFATANALTINIYFDPTPGDAKIMFSAKDSDGTDVHGEVALT